MAILQGTQQSGQGGVHPYVQIMQAGQTALMQGAQLGARAIEQSNAISSQYIRDALQQNLDSRRVQLEREKMAQTKELQERSLSLQERQMGQRASEFAQTMELKERQASQSRALQDRQLQIQGIRAETEMMKQRQIQRGNEAAERILGNAFNFPQVGPMPLDGGVPPPIGEEFGYEGMPPSLADATGQDLNPAQVANAALDMQIRGHLASMAQNPGKAGYYYSRIGELQAKRAEMLQAGEELGASARDVFQIADESVIPGSGLVEGPATQENFEAFIDGASPTLQIALRPDEQSWREVVEAARDANNIGDARAISEVYETRDALRREASARDSGLAQGMFLAERKYKTPGSKAVDRLVRANPYFQMIDRRLDQLDSIIGDGAKDWGTGPSQSELLKLESQASLVETDRETIGLLGKNLQNQWRNVPSSFYDRKAPVDVGGWKMFRLIPPADGDNPAIENFNRELAKYQRDQARLQGKENNLRRGIGILSGKNYPIGDINSRVFGERLEARDAPWDVPLEPGELESESATPRITPGKSISRGILQGFDSSR